MEELSGGDSGSVSLLQCSPAVANKLSVSLFLISPCLPSRPAGGAFL
jgi:hypothetical protein